MIWLCPSCLCGCQLCFAVTELLSLLRCRLSSRRRLSCSPTFLAPSTVFSPTVFAPSTVLSPSLRLPPSPDGLTSTVLSPSAACHQLVLAFVRNKPSTVGNLVARRFEHVLSGVNHAFFAARRSGFTVLVPSRVVTTTLETRGLLRKVLVSVRVPSGVDARSYL